MRRDLLLGGVGLDDLIEVVQDSVGGRRGVTNYKMRGLQLGHFLDGGLVDVPVEAGQKITVVHTVDHLPGYFLALNLRGKFYAKVEHHLEDEILPGTVRISSTKPSSIVGSNLSGV